MKLSVREMQREDIPFIVDYFVYADAEFLRGMGAEKSKLPERAAWIKKLNEEYEKPNEEKEFYYLIWLVDEQAVGHSNINNIHFGKTAMMHLHLWSGQKRQKGLGAKFVKKCIPFYFKNFHLEKLICEPYALNPAPNKTLPKIGFEFMREYETIPGWINFFQAVRRYEMTRKQFEELGI